MKPKASTLVFLLAAVVGVVFAAVSCYDFVQHLDRQLHGIHCSFIPGVGTPDATRSSGCSIALMSPFSSVLRKTFWGGIPIALPGLSVYAFLLFLGLDLWFNHRENSRPATLFLLLTSILPVLASIVMAVISATQLHAFCKLCIGMYSSAGIMLIAAFWAWRGAARPDMADAQSPDAPPAGKSHIFLSIVEGFGFVLVPLLAYIALIPDASGFVGKCGSLVKPEDPYGVMVPLDNHASGTPVTEVIDPLCPACRGFEHRVEGSGLDAQIHRQALLFPLDNSCNWMVGSALHPGACDVSEAVLCAGDNAPKVIAWAFENQENIKTTATATPGAARNLVTTAFPELSSCVGSPEVKARINRSLRWAVGNQLQVSMPQVFVEGVKLCDEDTDLGMDYALSRLLDPAFAAKHGITPVRSGTKAPKAP
jgi:uncharacterized membrane protein